MLEEILPTFRWSIIAISGTLRWSCERSLSAISRAKDELDDDEGYRALAQDMEDAAIDEEKQIAAAEVS